MADRQPGPAGASLTGMKDFAPGQRWTYRTRPGEETSTLLVLGRDQNAEGLVAVSLKVEDISLRPPIGGTITELQHAPFAEEVLRQSVLELLQENVALPADLGSYEAWRLAFETGEVGAFDLALADTLDLIDRATGQQPPSPEHPLFTKTNLRIIEPATEEVPNSPIPQGRKGQA